MLIKDKNALRKEYKALRNGMSLHQRRTADIEIFKNARELEAFQQAEEVLIYVSSAIEVDTYMLADYCFECRKKLYSPKCIPNSNDMIFYETESFDDLEKGSFGIYEPCEQCRKMNETEHPVCIVPGLAFDKRGYRLGFGKGFYDKFLAEFKGIKIGLCYDDCVTESLPKDAYDVPVDILVTENQCLFINNN
ncbi:MAG: 5-formyltetrahydrofolate cyclo-ligase [Oscillospiraceae bacterium]